MPPHSAPEPATLNLAARILAAGKARLSAADEASYTNPDSLATAVIEAGCKGVEAEDVAQHGRLARGSPGSQAQVSLVRKWMASWLSFVCNCPSNPTWLL